MKKNYLKCSLLTGLLLAGISSPKIGFSQNPGFEANDYKKALWMTTRMYGGQRAGDKNTTATNWLLIGHSAAADGRTFLGDADGDYDLSGGWFDCGDHVKFGHTEFYTAYVLLKGYSEFSKGYDDRYAPDFASYKSANNYTFEGSGHKGNSIPDILDEVKHATDYLIKCTRDASTFYYQVGEGGPDHTQWVTSAKMQSNPKSSGGQPRSAFKNPADGAMPALAGAALALMSRMYEPYDAAYAQKCLTHAEYAYTYAKAHKGQTVGAADGKFYGKNANPLDAYAALLGEMYWATNDEAYKTEALAMTVSSSSPTTDVRGSGWGLDYVNNGDLGAFNLYLLGKAGADTVFQNIVTKNYLSQVNADGIFSGGNASWGPLRYNANAALVVALWANRNTPTDAMKKFIYSNIDFIMGKNSKNYSFIVGFGSGATHPHHRNVYLSDANVTSGLTIPEKNTQHGYMVGGKRNPNDYKDVTNDYQNTEGGIDYSAGLVGALAYINSQVAPVTTSFPAVDAVPNPVVMSIKDGVNTESLVVYPNPSTDVFGVNAPANIIIKVYDNMGREVTKFNTSENTTFGNFLPTGFYHVVFFKGDTQLKTVNVIKQ